MMLTTITIGMSEVAMQCFLESNEPENVVWVFESIPAWKGDLIILSQS